MDFNYPILTCVDQNRSGELIIAQMASGKREQLLLKVNFGQFICFVKLPPNTGPGRDIGFVAYNGNEKKTYLYKLSVEDDMFHQGGLLKAKNWQKIDYQELKGKEFDRLHSIKDTIKFVKFFKGGDRKSVDDKTNETKESYERRETKGNNDEASDDNFGLLVQTKSDVQLLTAHKKIVVFKGKGGQAMHQ